MNVGSAVLTSVVIKRPVSWDITLCCFMLLSCLALSSTLKMELICSSETSFNFQHTRRRYILKDRTLQMGQLISPQLPGNFTDFPFGLGTFATHPLQFALQISSEKKQTDEPEIATPKSVSVCTRQRHR
jgi:hypothetical protein